MSASVLLFTDRSSFESAWRPVLEALGASVTTARPEQLPERLVGANAVVVGAIVVDAGASAYDEDELLAHLGLARALGALPAVMMPASDALASVDDLVDDLCGGLVARTQDDIARVSAVLTRRASARRARRFEYLTVSPRGGELLAILADGSAVLLPRPVHASDDKSEVAAIVLGDDALRATLELASGSKFELSADEIASRSGHGHGPIHGSFASVAFAGPSYSSGAFPTLGNGHAGDGAGAIGALATGVGAAGAVASGALTSGALGEIDGQRLGARIRSLRLQAGLTQAELARRTGIHRPNIARVEAGRHTPSLETLARLAAAIGVPTTRVLTGD